MMYILRRHVITLSAALLILGLGIGGYVRITRGYLFVPSCAVQSRTITTIYGTMHITEPVLIDLLDSKAVRRLKNIDQYGISTRIKPFMPYTRHEHSLGVLYILRRFGAGLHEQIAGLLHDVSHTVFSHVGDHLFDGQLESKQRVEAVDAYQDDKHEWYLHQTDVASILKKHGIAVKDILHKNKQFCMFDRELPELCADRLEYLLYGGYVEEIFSVTDVRGLLNNLVFKNGVWAFKTQESARRVADMMVYFMGDESWGSIWNAVGCRWAAQALKRAVDIGLLTFNDIHFSTDDEVWDTLRYSEDPIISGLVENILQCRTRFMVVSAADYDVHIVQKFRAINPWVLQEDGTMKRLTDIDSSYDNLLKKTKEIVAQGAYVKYVTASA